MNSQLGTVRLAIIDNESAFVRVLARRFETAGWEYRVQASSVPTSELISWKLNALLIDISVLGPIGWEFLERVCGMLPDLGVIVCTRARPSRSGSAACGSAPTTGSSSRPTPRR